MIHKNIWRPDTCGCEIEYEWDDAEPENSRTHSVSKIIKACPLHQGYSDDKTHYDGILDENQRKNLVQGKLLEISSATEDVMQASGETVKQLKPGKEYNWSFDENRNLVVDLIGFTETEKTAVNTAINPLFGSKVIIK